MEENSVSDCRKYRFYKVIDEPIDRMYYGDDGYIYRGFNPYNAVMKLINREERDRMEKLDCKECVYYEALEGGRMYCNKLEIGSFNTKPCSNYKEKVLTKNEEGKEYDVINKAEHYNQGIEVIDIIESHNLNFSEGNVIKYTLRAKYKGSRLQDLRKAEYYLKRLIEEVENEQRTSNGND